ncbi:hypothetical protein EB001_26360 [bacterium]|nr:hypothetical protein [bacterium]
MNEDINNNPVDNVVNNVIEDSKALTPVDSLPIDTIETEEDKQGRGRPPHLPNADTRNKVYTLSTVGTRHEDIASVLNISHDTLVKY